MLIRTFLTILIIVFAGATWLVSHPELVTVNGQEKGQKKVVRYACPMHPEVQSTRQRRCPKCGMNLRLVADPVAADSSTPATGPTAAVENGPSFSSSQIPDVRVYDQKGNEINFYKDLIKDKTVAINFIFTTCTTICPPLTATFRRVQRDLAVRAPQVRLISVSVDPTTDTPERLREFAAKFNAGPGWVFVTGGKSEIDSLLQQLGVAVADKNDHTPMVLIGNDTTDYWTRTYGLSSPTALVNVILEAATHK